MKVSAAVVHSADALLKFCFIGFPVKEGFIYARNEREGFWLDFEALQLPLNKFSILAMLLLE